jgi:kynureninase
MTAVVPTPTREEVLELDRADPLSRFRERFLLPEGVVYLDGNSLGPPPVAVEDRIREVITSEWGNGLVRSWNDADWIEMPLRVAAKIAPLIGASPEEVMVADSVSVNLFKLIAGALTLRPGRTVILSEQENFGTDLYIADGVAKFLGDRAEIRVVPRGKLLEALDENVAVVMLTHVDFRTGEMHDMASMTRTAHDVGALALWDLAHSVGAVEVDLRASGPDLAVGCGYKYLNGGPGAPAFAYVARRHHQGFLSPLQGWMGHRAPFEFTSEYVPAEGVRRLGVGTPPILSLAALECGVESVAEIGVRQLRAKSVAMTELFLALVEGYCGDADFEVASPRDPASRGSQVSLRHRGGYAIMRALTAEGVIGDFRAPDLLRFGFAPAYLRFIDVWDAVMVLERVMGEETWRRPEFQHRLRVT